MRRDEQYRADIDGLRAVAIIPVVLFHAFPAMLGGGFVGVDVFFVISGFVITRTILADLAGGVFTLRAFYARRARRIFPALVTVLLACLAFGTAALLADELRQLGKHVAGGAAFLANLVLRRESGYFDNGADTKPLLHLWSLAIEEQFYLGWPLLLALVSRARGSAPRAIPLVIVVVIVSSFGLCLDLTFRDAATAFYSPLTRVWELGCGGLLAALHANAHEPARERSPTRHVASVAGALVLVLAFIVVDGDGDFPGAWAVLPVLGAALLVAAGRHGVVNETVLSHPLLVAVGKASYPLYLWHWPLLAFARIIDGSKPPALVRASLVVVALVLSGLTVRYVERPIRFGPRTTRRMVLVVVALVVTGALGGGVFLLDGLPHRPHVEHITSNRAELERTPARDEACTRRLGADPVFDYCRLLDVHGAETVAVIGDSHAHVAFPGIAELNARRGVNTVLLANSGCPPFLGGEYGDGAAEVASCRARTDAIVRAVTSSPDITQVIVFSRGTLYITGKGFGDAEKDQPVMIPPATFASSLQRTADELRAHGKKVAYVLENPELGFDPGACIERPLRPSARPCVVDRAVVEARQASYRALLSSLQDVTVLDPAPAFCDATACHAMLDDALLYADDDHLSVAGSRLQASRVVARGLGWSTP